MSENAARFWDNVFASNKTDWVADHPASYFMEIFGLVGPFEREFREAARGIIPRRLHLARVLDVGPGRGRLLRAAGYAARYAIEISEVNAAKLRADGVRIVHPDTHELDDAGIDLAWSTSCLPHCDYPMQIALLQQVHRALLPGGVFYLEHVMQRRGRPDCPEELRLPAGRYHLLPSDAASWWPGGGFRWVDRDVGGDDCPLRGWVARCEK